uniref:Secreted protein n=1 Tax=Macrostomum lignano TaxID=282301 RepID=A0A1I8HQJ0_9PLAT
MQTWRLLLPLCLFCLPAINCQLRVERNKISSVFWEYHAWSRNTGENYRATTINGSCRCLKLKLPSSIWWQLAVHHFIQL